MLRDLWGEKESRKIKKNYKVKAQLIYNVRIAKIIGKSI